MIVTALLVGPAALLDWVCLICVNTEKAGDDLNLDLKKNEFTTLSCN